MANIVTPFEITPEQIGKIQELLGAGLRKAGFLSESVQQVIENQGSIDSILADELVAVLRRSVEAVNGIIVRRVTVNRTRSPQEVLNATGRSQYVGGKVVKTMPCGEGEELDVYFFNLGCSVNDGSLEKEYKLRGLKPADPYSLAAVNEADPAFADKHPNSTRWMDADSRCCYAAFDCRDNEHRVLVNSRTSGWGGQWWFAGFRK